MVSKKESDLNYLYIFRELGKEYSFEVEGLYSTIPDSWPELEEIWFLKVHAPDLEAFRKKYFLTATPNGHSFHIVVGIKPREKNKMAPKPAPLLRINPVCNPV